MRLLFFINNSFLSYYHYRINKSMLRFSHSELYIHSAIYDNENGEEI